MSQHAIYILFFSFAISMHLFPTLLALCGAYATATTILNRRQAPAPAPPPNAAVPPSEAPTSLAITDQFHIPIFTPALHGLQTLKLILGNGVKVFIVSDPGIIKAGAGMAVDTGSWRDPRDALGLGMCRW
jgi:hypothetical protein